LRFTLSFRDVEDLLAERGIVVSYETVRRWVNHFGPMIAAGLRKRRPKPHSVWHLDDAERRAASVTSRSWRIRENAGERGARVIAAGQRAARPALFDGKDLDLVVAKNDAIADRCANQSARDRRDVGD
jgi:hypothetical protein